jgi:hypothetical protein
MLVCLDDGSIQMNGGAVDIPNTTETEEVGVS